MASAALKQSFLTALLLTFAAGQGWEAFSAPLLSGQLGLTSGRPPWALTYDRV